MSKKGFTLIELLVVISIVGLLAGIAYPSYINYVVESRRADGQTALLDLASKMERYFTMSNTYVGATLSNVGASTTSPQGYYQLSISNLSGTTYQLQATPLGTQTRDTQCATLSIDQLGQKTESGTGSAQDCW